MAYLQEVGGGPVSANGVDRELIEFRDLYVGQEAERGWYAARDAGWLTWMPDPDNSSDSLATLTDAGRAVPPFDDPGTGYLDGRG